jgi:hypothetical protein
MTGMGVMAYMQARLQERIAGSQNCRGVRTVTYIYLSGFQRMKRLCLEAGSGVGVYYPGFWIGRQPTERPGWIPVAHACSPSYLGG